ncbi:hypothetical protein Pfo_000553 [Paulownia fortunei]|nr:hypothetical protein Pfo_000553 [Paulownia fortunei]
MNGPSSRMRLNYSTTTVGRNKLFILEAKMRAFIKFVDERAWCAVVIGWEHPMMINEQKEKVLKPEDQLNTEEEKNANYNSKALNAIFSAIDTILQTAYEGTATIRMLKLQILASRFEDLRIEESETIATFNAKLCDIANEPQALGKKYLDCKLVQKALRSLPERFAYKVTVIKEARDIEKLKLDELMGSLQIFGLNLNHNKRDKGKSVAFQAEITKSTPALEDNDDMSESLALVTKFFEKFLKMMDENSNKPKSGKSFNSQKDKTNFNSFDDRKNRRIQYRECEGFGHIQAECANTLKWMDKSLTTTWTDEESEGSQENDHTAFGSKMMNYHREHVATNQRYISDSETNSDDDEPNIEEIQQMYNKMFRKWLEICKINKPLEKQIIMMKLDSGKKKLDEILSIGKPYSDHHGLGYTGKSSTLKTIFVKETKLVRSIFDKSKKSIFQKPKPKRFIPICHFCNLPGHIRPKYFRFKKALRNGIHFDSHASAIRIWIRKSDLRCFVADICLKACIDDTWYFDSGCSRHMTGDKKKLKGYQSVNEGHVIFGDGEKGRKLRKGVLNVEGLSKLKNVLHVESLKANLISISQLLFDETDRCVLIGSRSFNNYYMLQQPQACYNIKVDETDLWHQKLGHLNFKNLIKIVNTRAMLRVPKLNKKNLGVWDACHIGKQKKGTHKVLQHISTSHTLELLHMDLMGLMQVESLGEKRVILNFKGVVIHFWAEAVSTACYTINRKEKIVEKLKDLESPHFPNNIFYDNSSAIDIFKTHVQH